MANLEKIIELINRTGDRCIIVDMHGNPAYVALSFEEYERLVAINRVNLAELSEEEMLDKINRDVAAWRASQQEEQLGNWDSIENAIGSVKGGKKAEAAENSLSKEKNDRSENHYYFEPIE